MLKKLLHLMITIIIFLVTIISFKSSEDFKNWFQVHVLNNSFSFTNIASKYESLFGNPIPFKSFIKEKPVFSEKINYSSLTQYNNGILLNVDNNLIPSIGEGLIIFIGKKDNQNCIIVDQKDVEVTYCMLKHIGVKLYDHIEAGSYIGEVDQKLLLYFTKNGEYLNYEDFI